MVGIVFQTDGVLPVKIKATECLRVKRPLAAFITQGVVVPTTPSTSNQRIDACVNSWLLVDKLQRPTGVVESEN
jgi:hypothetical protein